MRFARTATAALLLAALAAGCAPRAKTPRATVQSGGLAPEEVTLAATDKSEGPAGPQAGAKPSAQGPPTAPPAAVEPAANPRSDAARDAQAEEQERAAKPPAPASRASGPRKDGRPSWWIDEPRTVDGRTTLAAEALGDDVLGARRAAIEAGRAALRRAVGGAIADERIAFASVRPLPATTGAGTGPRFVGYVLISAAQKSPD